MTWQLFTRRVCVSNAYPGVHCRPATMNTVTWFVDGLLDYRRSMFVHPCAQTVMRASLSHRKETLVQQAAEERTSTVWNTLGAICFRFSEAVTNVYFTVYSQRRCYAMLGSFGFICYFHQAYKMFVHQSAISPKLLTGLLFKFGVGCLRCKQQAGFFDTNGQI
jgi:hypothetical protein